MRLSVEEYRRKGLGNFRAIPKRNKFGAVRTEFKGQTYDSKAEAARAAELQLLQRAGKISDLKSQADIPLVAGIILRLDFTYKDAGGKIHYEDVKGGKATQTAVFRLKRRLFEHLNHPAVIEIYQAPQ